MSTQPPCETVEDEEIECWNCEDKGFTVTVGGLQIPCSDCKTGDMFFYHERDKDLAAMVHVEGDERIDDYTAGGMDSSDFLR
jgi:hypothetical protein